jgi:aminodeoxyfutalosine synthase
MHSPLDPGQLRDSAIRPVATKVLAGIRLDVDDARALYATSDLLGLGQLAAFANHRTNGDRVYFSANQHINPTNVCILRNTCTFCSFARMP